MWKIKLGRYLPRQRFHTRLLLILIFLIVSLISISSLGSNTGLITANSNLFLNYHQYFALVRQKYPPSQTGESFCQTGLKFVAESNGSLIRENHPDCDSHDWVKFDRFGRMSFDRVYLDNKSIRVKFCKYADVKWSGDDYGFVFGDFERIDEGGKVRNGTEFFKVICKSDSAQYNGAFARLFEEETPKKDTKHPLSVFLLGFDSVSRIDWPRSLPESTKSFTQLGGVVMNGLNVLGDGTPASLVPLLTRRLESELPNTLRNTLRSRYVDEAYPFIWTNFSRQLGYETLFGEDYPEVGTFQYRMRGMRNPPVDHYMRPFELFVKEMQNKSTKCVGTRSLIRIHLEYAHDFMRKYGPSGFFGLMFFSTYSHDATSHLTWVDHQLNTFLSEFRTSQEFESTLLVLFSDHGPRYSNERKSTKGLLKERNPFLAIYSPDLQIRSQLEENSHRLVTPLDLGHSLLDLISYLKPNQENKPQKVNEKYNRYMNLFRESIPSNRTCKQAGIDDHWCACLTRTELSTPNDNPYLQQIARRFSEFVNWNILSGHLGKCKEIEVTRINRAYLLEARQLAKRDFKSEPGLLTSFFEHLAREPSIEIDYENLMLEVETNYGGVFEFTAEHEFHLDTFRSKVNIKADSISRINLYGNASWCIHENFPDLRKYCACRQPIQI